MANNKKLEVGDVLYTSRRWSGLQKQTIQRVTEKQAFSASKKFVRQPNANGEYSLIGEYSSVGLATNEEHERYRMEQFRAKALRKISETKFDSMSESQLTRILAIINETK